MLSNIKQKIREKQAQQYIKKLHYSFDGNWFKNKRVAIIGGADSVLKEKLGEYIDGFDVVVRINKGVEIIDKQKEYIGTRTDILFHSFMDNPKEPGSSPITGDLWKKFGVGKIVYSTNYKQESRGIYDIILFAKKTNSSLKFTDIPVDFYKSNVESIAPYNPTTGHIAINTITHCQPKELYITGITFFKTPHNKEYRKDREGVKKKLTGEPGTHNPEAEYQYFKKLYLANEKIIRPDATLLEIIKTN